MAAGDVGDLGAGKHSCNLLNPRATINPRRGSAGLGCMLVTNSTRMVASITR